MPVQPFHYEVLISAGHEGRPQNCVHFPQRHCNLGAAGERAWTPIVADAAATALRADGFTVARRPADFPGDYRVKAAIYIHFDGARPPCSSGASIGYPRNDAASRHAAHLWHKMYGAIFPFRWEPDDFTVGLREYYAYKAVHAQDGSLVVELGEITCPAQRAWLAPRLRSTGRLVARLLEVLIRPRRPAPPFPDLRLR